MTRNAGLKVDEGTAPAFLLEGELAARWKTSRRTLQRLRRERSGPAYFKLGGSIRYMLNDVLYYEAHRRRPGEVLST